MEARLLRLERHRMDNGIFELWEVVNFHLGGLPLFDAHITTLSSLRLGNIHSHSHARDRLVDCLTVILQTEEPFNNAKEG